MKNTLILLLTLSSLSLSAATTDSGEVSTTKAVPMNQSQNHLLLDGAPLLVGGAGLSYERVLNPNWTLGPSISFFQLKSNDDTKTSKSSDVTIKNKITMLGVRSRYFFTGVNMQSGYVLLGINSIDISTEAQIADTTPGTASSNTVGGVAGVGYQLLGNEVIGNNPLIVSLSALVGNGYAVGTTAYSENKGPTKVQSPEAGSSLFLEAAAGVMF